MSASITRDTSSSLGGMSGFSRMSARLRSLKTILAATRSVTVSAASPISRSPDFSSFALPKSSFRSLKE